MKAGTSAHRPLALMSGTHLATGAAARGHHDDTAPDAGAELLAAVRQAPMGGVGALQQGRYERHVHYANLARLQEGHRHLPLLPRLRGQVSPHELQLGVAEMCGDTQTQNMTWDTHKIGRAHV